MRKPAIFLVSLFLFIAPVSLGDPRADCGIALERLNQLIGDNHFETRRDFENYALLLPPSFLTQLSQLRRDGHWIDAGSGEGFAVEDFFNPYILDPIQFLGRARGNYYNPRRTVLDVGAFREVAEQLNNIPISDKPQVTGVTFKMERKPEGPAQLSFKAGRYFEDIPLSEFHQANLITDLYGVMSYSPRIDEVLRRYHRLLRTGGRAYIFIGDYVETPDLVGIVNFERVGTTGWDAPFAQSSVRERGGAVVPLLDWLKKISGFRMSIENRRLEQNTRAGLVPGAVLRSTIVLEKVSEEAAIPAPKLIYADDGKPPIRTFEEIDPP